MAKCYLCVHHLVIKELVVKHDRLRAKHSDIKFMDRSDKLSPECFAPTFLLRSPIAPPQIPKTTRRDTALLCPKPGKILKGRSQR